jgi:hypothetical protein
VQEVIDRHTDIRQLNKRIKTLYFGVNVICLEDFTYYNLKNEPIQFYKGDNITLDTDTLHMALEHCDQLSTKVRTICSLTLQELLHCAKLMHIDTETNYRNKTLIYEIKEGRICISKIFHSSPNQKLFVSWFSKSDININSINARLVPYLASIGIALPVEEYSVQELADMQMFTF